MKYRVINRRNWAEDRADCGGDNIFHRVIEDVEIRSLAPKAKRSGSVIFLNNDDRRCA